MNISEPLPEKWFFQPQGLLVGSGCTEIQQFRKPAPSPLPLILWSFLVINSSQCVHFLNFLSAVREGTSRKAINLSVKFSVLESFSEQCSRLLLKYSFPISHKLWLFIFPEFRKPSWEVIGVTYLEYQKVFLFWTMPSIYKSFFLGVRWIVILVTFFSPQAVGGKAGSGEAGSKCWNPLAWQALLEGAILSGAARCAILSMEEYMRVVSVKVACTLRCS